MGPKLTGDNIPVNFRKRTSPTGQRTVYFQRVKSYISLLRSATYTLFCLILCGVSFASDHSSISRADVEKKISLLANSSNVAPAELIDQADALISLSEKNNWADSLLAIATLKVETLVLLEELGEAERLIKKYYPLAVEQKNEEFLIKLKLAQLTIDDSSKAAKGIIEKQHSLLDNANTTEKPLYAGLIYLGVGQSQYVTDNLYGALESFKKSYDIALSIPDTGLLAATLSSLANIHTDLGDPETAIKYLQEAIDINATLNDPLGLSILYYNTGEAYSTLNEYDNAIVYFDKSISVSKKIHDTMGVAWAQSALARVYLATKKPSDALRLYQESSSMFGQSGDEKKHVESLTGQAKSYIQLNNPKKAQDMLSLIKPLLAPLDSRLLMSDYSEALVAYNALIGEYKKAFEVQSDLMTQKEAFFKEELKQDTQRFRVQFDAEIMDSKNKILTKENELKQLEIQKQNESKKLSTIIISLSVLTICVFMLLLHIQTKNRNSFKEMALKDHLTNSPNRRAILKYAFERFKEAEATSMELSICIIDLDYFKKINDSYGHDTGDEVLKSLAESCRETFRKQDRFGRYGGEEWLVVLSDTHGDHIKRIFTRLSEQFNAKEVSGIPSSQQLTFSVGVAQFDISKYKTLQELINRADEKLYEAKNSGRNRVVM